MVANMRLCGHVKECGFDSKCYGKLLGEGMGELRRSMICLYFKDLLAAVWEQTVEQEWKQS